MPKPVYRPKDVKNSLSILFSLPARLNNPDLIERAIPILCKAVKDRSNNISDNDVVDYLEALAQEAAAHPTRDGRRSQIRLYLARALVTKDQSIRESSLKEIAQIGALNPGLADDTEQLFDAVARNMVDADLRSVVDVVHKHLTLLREKSAGGVAQKS